MAIRGVDAFLEVLSGCGVKYLFGNPGTTELPLNDALVGDSRFQYILGLQEVPVMAMADGFSMASGSLGVVNLHISCGLGNAMGMLYNAYREGTPLLVTAGQQDRRLVVEEPILGGDMVSVTRPWTKWSAEVLRVQDLPTLVRRAAQTALTPPTGPVFLSLPMDVQLELAADLDLSPGNLPDPHIRPSLHAVAEAVRILSRAKNPGILAGSRIPERDAVPELVRVAELLGAPVMSESATSHGRVAFPSDHPLKGEALPLWAPDVRQRLAEFDVLLVAGMDLLRQYVYFEPARAIPEHIQLVHLDEDPWQIGKNYPVAAGVLGHTKESLREIGEALGQQMSADEVAAARKRSVDRAARHSQARELLRQEIVRQAELRPMTPLTLMASLARILPPNVVVVEEAVTTTDTVFERLGTLKNTTGYFGHRGWALGWGLGCALGAKLAWPERPVLALLGDGAALYGICGLWSAARYRIPVALVICNNAQYRILKVGARTVGLPHALQGRFEGFDLVQPEIDFIRLAESFGVRATRANTPEELSDQVQETWRDGAPRVIEAPIQRGDAA